jgi:hypothetical protein
MFTAIILTFTSLFMYDNSEFFSEVKKERAEGYRFEYVGKQSADEYTHSIPVINQETGEEFIYWQHKKPQE